MMYYKKYLNVHMEWGMWYGEYWDKQREIYFRLPQFPMKGTRENATRIALRYLAKLNG